MSVKIKVNWDMLLTLKSMEKGGRVKVGWRENTKYDDNTPVYKIAEIQEYGARIPVTDKMRRWFAAQGFPLKKTTTEIVIPPRPFIRQTADRNKKKWMWLLREKLVKALDGKLTFEQALNQLGLRIEGDLKETISTFSEPANAPMTIAMKGKDTPLRNTGIMLDTIDYEVETNETS